MNFIAPIFLYGLSAIAIPIIIHLIELRRAKKIYFTNVSFLKEVKNITSSHRRLKQILILLARIGFVIALVFVFAQPFIPNNVVNRNSNQIKFYIDNSLSLQNESEESGKNLLDIAVDHSKSVIRALGENTKYNFIENGSASSVYSDFTGSKMDAKINDLSFSASSKPADIILANLGFGSANYDALVYSDFQKSNFTPKAFDNLNENNQYYLIHLKGEAAHNAFVDSIYLEDEFIRINQINKIRVRVRNSGTNNIESCPVKFFIGQQQISALNVSIPAKQSVSFVLNYRLNDTGLKQCRIVLQDFPIEFDNTYYFTLKASPAISIVDVSERGASAVAPLYTNEPLFQYQNITPQQFNYTLLKTTDLVILNSLNSLTAAFADNIREYVESGGNIAFIPGAKANAGSYATFFNRLNLNNIQSRNINATQPVMQQLALPDADNPFFENIFENASAKMVMPNAARTLSWRQSSSDILRFKDGSKYLSVFNKAKGKVYVFASPLQEGYSDFMNHALFVPIMYKVAMESYTNEQDLAYTVGGAAIRLPVDGINNKEVFKLVKDSISYIPGQDIRNGNVYLTMPNDVAESGFYELMVGDDKKTTLALNYNEKESDMEYYSAADLKELVRDQKNVRVLEASDEVAIKKIFSNENFGTQLWKYCLILCLIFILTEILLIRFM